MANYPTADPSFSNKSAGGQIQSAHINALQDEVVAIGSALRGTLQHSVTTANSVVASSNLSVGGNSTLTGSVTLSSLVTAPNQPRVFAVRSSTLAVPSGGAWTVVPCNAELFDVGTLHSTATNPTRCTVPTGSSGLYHIVAQAALQPIESTGYFALAIGKNTGGTTASTAMLAAQVAPRQVLGITNTIQCQTYAVLDAGDYVELFVSQNSSVASTSALSNSTTGEELWVKNWLQMVRIW